MNYAKKYYDMNLKFLENVTVEDFPLFRNGILIKDEKDNTILIYEGIADNVVTVTTKVGNDKTVEKMVYDSAQKNWIVLP